MRIFGRSFPMQSRISRVNYPPTKVISAAGIPAPSKNNIKILTSGSSLVNGSNYSTVSIQPSVDTLVVAVFAERLSSGTFTSSPTAAGNGMTWAKIGVASQTIPISSPTRRLTAFWALSGSTSAGALTFTSTDVTWESGEWIVFEVGGADSAGNPIVQNVANTIDNTLTISTTLAAFASANNTAIAMVLAGISADITPEVGWERVDQVSVTESAVVTTLQVQELSGVDTSPNATVLSLSPMTMLAIEIKAATPRIKTKIYHTGIASAEAFGSVVIKLADRVLPTGIPSAEAFGSVSVIYNHRMFPTGIPSAESFGTPQALSAIGLTNGGSDTDLSSYNTASISPSANKLILALVYNYRGSGNPTIPTCSGNGLTWVQVATSPFSTIASPTDRITVFRAMGAAPTTGAVTFTFSNTQSACSWQIHEWSGADTTGTNGSGAIVQSAVDAANSATSLTVTLAAFESPYNGAVSFFGSTSNSTNFSPDTGWSELYDQGLTSSQGRLQTQTRANNDTTAKANTNLVFGISMAGIALEIKAAAAALHKFHQQNHPSGIASEEAFGTATTTSRLYVGSGVESPTTADPPIVRGSGNNDTSLAQYNFTPGSTPSSDTLTLLLIRNSKSTGPSLPSPTGLGMTWAQEESMSFGTIAAPQLRLTLFRAVGTPVPGNLTIDFSGVAQDSCSYVLIEVPGAKITGSNASDGIPQSETNRADNTASPLTVTLGSFFSKTNGAMVFFASGSAVGNISPEVGWTKLVEFAAGIGGSRLAVHWRQDRDETATGTFDVSTPQGAIAIELSYLGKGFGIPSVYEQGKDFIRPAGIPSAEAFGVATMDGGAVGVGRGHIIDGATFAAYRLDNTLNDSSPNGRNISLFAGAAVDTDPVIFDKGRSRYFNGSTHYQAAGSGSWNSLWLGEWTVEMWLLLGDTNVASVSLLSYHVPASELQADNQLVRLSLSYSSGNYKGEVMWENGAGVDVSYTTSANIITSANARKRHHVAWRKRSVGGGNYVVDFYSNGIPRETSSSMANADGGGNSNFYLGGDTSLFFGRIDDVRISNVSRTPAEIFESYRRGLGGAPRTVIVVGGS